eukprot:Pgem_evm1s16429
MIQYRLILNNNNDNNNWEIWKNKDYRTKVDLSIIEYTKTYFNIDIEEHEITTSDGYILKAHRLLQKDGGNGKVIALNP